MKISVIISTYNWPEALRLSVESLLNQTDCNYELVIADDGSGNETRDLIENIKRKTKLKIIHAWQEDLGFRLAKSRNNAVKLATGDYLIFIDGDCVVPRQFIENHRKLAEKGFVVAGTRVLLSQKYSLNLLSGSTALDFSRGVFYYVCKYINGDINKPFPMLNAHLGGLMRVLARKKWRVLRGCNWAVYKKDYESVNGQDESFEGWGLEDSDMAIRLISNNVNIKLGKLAGIPVFHIWHPQKDRNGINDKVRILEDRVRRKIIYPNKGMH